jgi:hypothetical protein
MENNNTNIEENTITDRHKRVNDVVDIKEYNPDMEKKIEDYIKEFTNSAKYKNGELKDKDFENWYKKKNEDFIFSKFTQEELNAISVNLKSIDNTVKDDVLVKNENNYVNDIVYSDDNINTRSLTYNKNTVATGIDAINVFSSILGIGEVIQIPLWHSGFRITIRPPKINDLVNLMVKLSNNEIELGRKTSTLIYSNDSVIYSNMLVEFIINHITDSTLDIELERLTEFISLHDLHPMILGLLCTIYPTGTEISKACYYSNSIEEDKKCNFIATGKVDLKKLLNVDRTILNNKMLKIMSNKKPNSVSVEDVKDYQYFINEKNIKKINILTNVDSTVEITLKIPNLKESMRNGERWVEDVINNLESVFTKTDSMEDKNMKINDLVENIAIGKYNIFVNEILYVKDNISVRGEDVDEVLNLLTRDGNNMDNILKEIETFINITNIAVVGTSTYICPNCNKDQSELNNNHIKEILPLDMLQIFFDLGSLLIMKRK